jgi:hypothetical protein
MTFSCKNCAAWDPGRRNGLPGYESIEGLCRRTYPQRDADGIATWPLTRHDAWCLEYIGIDIFKDELREGCAGY